MVSGLEASLSGYSDGRISRPRAAWSTWSLLDRDPTRPGFEHDHHELLALAAPRALMAIGCSTDQATAPHSDDRQSVAYVAGAKKVYGLLNVALRFEYVPLTCGHQATSPEIDAAWQKFFSQWLLGIQ